MSTEEKEVKPITKRGGKKNIIQYNLNPSGSLLFEDHLNRCLDNSKGKATFKQRLVYAPRLKHSPFGDFPKDFMPKKNPEFMLMNNEIHRDTSLNERNKKFGANLQKSIAFTSMVRKTNEKAPVSGAIFKRKIPLSEFRLHYDRGDLPILIEHMNGTRIHWKEGEDFDKFNFQMFLPIFVDGIREKTDPYRFLAIEGTFNLLDKVRDVVVKVIPQLIIPLKTALNTRDPEIIEVALKVSNISYIIIIIIPGNSKISSFFRVSRGSPGTLL